MATDVIQDRIEMICFRYAKMMDNSVISLSFYQLNYGKSVGVAIVRRGKEDVSFEIDQNRSSPYKLIPVDDTLDKVCRKIKEKLLEDLPYMDRKVRMMNL